MSRPQQMESIELDGYESASLRPTGEEAARFRNITGGTQSTQASRVDSYDSSSPPVISRVTSRSPAYTPLHQNQNSGGSLADAAEALHRVRIEPYDPHHDIRPSYEKFSSPSNENETAAGPPSHAHTYTSSSSWDLLSGLRKFEHEIETFDPSNAREAHLQFAEGDIPNNGVARFYNYLVNLSLVTRWVLYIVPILGLLWIPGILGLTAFKQATIWNVKLIWWSIWLSVVWGGWWGALATARVSPFFVRHTIAVVAVGTRPYVEWLAALHRYTALFGWTISIWVSFQPLIDKRSTDGNIASEVSLLAKLLFSFCICAGILLFEKFSIQFIASKFHERSYADRIAEQRAASRILITLYAHSSGTPQRTETLVVDDTQTRNGTDPRRLIKKALKGVRTAATTTTTVLGNVASEIAGTSVLQPNSPEAMVQTALTSVNKSRMLARRIFYSYRKPGSKELHLADIARFFRTSEEADYAFAFFDKDENGSATREEVEQACMDCHREQLSLEHSMSDLDSAVARLDNILMSLYVFIALLVIAVALEAQLLTLVTGAGTFVLGLSWLIGSSLTEVLTSIIYLFVKHPYDVGDRLEIDGAAYTVKEMRLLSTVMLDKNSCSVQAPHSLLNTKFILNLRRSPQMSESFKFDVAYSTTFEKIEALRTKMLAFVQSESRDFLPSFDVTIDDFPDQEKMCLSADIKYKSNWQQGAIKVKRRNKWICALKVALHEVEIYGPKGNPDADPGVTKYTEMPWDDFQKEKAAAEKKKAESPAPAPAGRGVEGSYDLADKNAAIIDDAAEVFGERSQIYESPTSTMQGLGRPTLIGVNTGMSSTTNLARTRGRAGTLTGTAAKPVES